MSELTVGILGFVCIIAIVITLFKSKTMPSMAFIIFPSILGLILVLGGYYTIGEIGDLIKGGFKSTGPTAALFVFSVLFFGIMTDAGMFDVIIDKLMKCVGDNVIESINMCKYFTIICNDPEPICEFITQKLNRSATVYHAEGAYQHNDKAVILSVMKRSQAVELRNFIHENQPSAFIAITNSSEIIGKGFRGLN